MFTGFYSSLSGMISFQQGLNNISHNLANMNSPGFKGNDMQFRGMLGNSGSYVAGEGTNFIAGDIRQTGNPLNAAINGNGFFILQDESGRTYYTRGGDFTLENEFLVDRVTGYKVMGFDDNGGLQPISLKDYITLDPIQTSQINFSNNLNLGLQLAPGETKVEFEIKVFNSLGEDIEINLRFRQNTEAGAADRSYLIDVKNADGEIIVDENGDPVNTIEIQFESTGEIKEGFDDLILRLPEDSNGAIDGDMEISLNFGPTEDSDGAKLSSLQTDMVVRPEDGRSRVGLVDTSFDEDGVLVLKYSNEDEESPFTLGLAYFSDTSVLKQSNGSLFKATEDSKAIIGRANSGTFGSVVGESQEASNVDMVGEFSALLLMQRGYQASSQALNVANEFIEQLYKR